MQEERTIRRGEEEGGEEGEGVLYERTGTHTLQSVRICFQLCVPDVQITMLYPGL